jgi:hypothetical protein
MFKSETIRWISIKSVIENPHLEVRHEFNFDKCWSDPPPTLHAAQIKYHVSANSSSYKGLIHDIKHKFHQHLMK